jgi:alpha-mannosidase
VRARLRVERTWGRSTLTEEFLLGHRGDHLKVRARLDWREQAHLLKLRFPTALIDPRATYEVPFGVVERPLDGAENPAHSWVDLSGTIDVDGARVPAGLAVINTAKHGFDTSTSDGGAEGSPSIGMTAVRSPVYSWHDPRRLDSDGLYSYTDQGIQEFRYAIVPHAGDWRQPAVLRRSAELAASVRAMLESFHGGVLPDRLSFAGDDGGPVMITALKGSEDDDALIVRAAETTGRAGTARLELPVTGRVLEAEFGPDQIRTFRVPTDLGEPVTEVDLVEWPLADGPRGALREEQLAEGPIRAGAPGPWQQRDRGASALTSPAERLAPGQDDG